MIEAIGTIFTLLTSGAGGGLLGGVFGIFKQREERKERIEFARLDIQRDEMEYKNASEERKHELTMLEANSRAEVTKTQTEADKEIEVANQRTLATAQRAFTKLNTSQGMDNYRASVRPTIAYWACILFTAMIAWAFYKFHHLITADVGLEILTGLFATLTFVVTSATTFYFVSRRNNAPR